MKTLTKDQESHIKTIEDNAERLGLKTVARDIATEKRMLNEKNYIKVNLPDTLDKFETGNGEGIWAVPNMPSDQSTSDSNIIGDSFDVIVLNDCLSYPFRYGTIINVTIKNTEHRPVLTFDWMGAIIRNISGDTTTLSRMLSDEDESEDEAL